MREVLTAIWKERAELIEQEICEILEVRDLTEYIRKPALFFCRPPKALLQEPPPSPDLLAALDRFQLLHVVGVLPSSER